MEFLMIVFGIAALVALYVIMTRNSIVRSRNQVKRSWADVLVHVQKKMKIIPRLKEEVESHKAYEKDTLSAIVQMREAATQVTSNSTPAQVAKAEEAFAAGVKTLKFSAEAYPELKTSELYRGLMSEIVEQQEDISAGITIYNRNVEHFNNLIEEFPSSAVNGMFNKETQLDSFNVTEGLEESVGFKPNFK